MAQPPITIEYLIDLKENHLLYRHGDRHGNGKRRPPEFTKLVAFIDTHFAGHLRTKVMPWSVTPTRKVGRLISYTGKRREGFKLEVYRPRDPNFHPFWWHVTCETYRSNWDIIDEIVKWHRKIEKDGNLDEEWEE